MTEWLTAVEFAALAGIRRRVASRIIKAAFRSNASWRSHMIEVRLVHDRGGASGKCYRVKVSSLPAYLQDRLKALQTPVETRSDGAPGETTTRQHLWWIEFIRPVVAHPKGSPERTATLAQLAGVATFDWQGMPYTPQLRTLQRQAKRLDDNQTAARRGRADKGAKRTFVSRTWDGAVPFDDATKERIATELAQDIRGLVKGGAARGHIPLLASRRLRTLTRAEGFKINDLPFLDSICAVPKHLVEAEWHYRAVHQFKRDRKAYEDSKPRLPRSISGMRPMQTIFGDVHPVDVHVVREDGSLATCRFIAFMDVATQRVRGRLVLLEKGGGVRNVDVIEAFADMVEDPAWGMPETFYIDNGKEYLFADLLGDAMQLVVRGFHGPSRSCQITRALPYNPAAKQIERFFGDFEKRYLSTLPGWIGGDRMKKRQEAVGRTVAPFGTFHDFYPVFYALLASYHAIPQGPKAGLAGQSPDAAFRGQVAADWAAIVMSRDEVRAACGKNEVRTVVAGCVAVADRKWTCRELQAWPHVTVTVRVPAYHDPVELLLLDAHGEPLGIAQEDRPWSFTDSAGAREASSRAAARRESIRTMDRGTPTIAVSERLIALGNESPSVIPNKPAGVITHNPIAEVRVQKAKQRNADAAEAATIAQMRDNFLRKSG